MRSETSPRKCPHPRVLIPELHAFRSRTGRGRLLASSSRGVAPPAAIATVLLTIAVELVARRAGGDDARSYEAAATVEGCAVVGRALCGVARPELGGAHTHAFGRAGAGEELAEGVHVTFCSLRTERGAKEEVARDLRARGADRAVRRRRAWLAEVDDTRLGSAAIARAPEIHVDPARRPRDARSE